MPCMMDLISRLPDEILCHILSFLQTHEAVATSLLSKRWRNLWISVPALDFNHFEFRRATRKFYYFFEHVVNKAILARDSRQPITRFKLLYETTLVYNSSALVNDWVNTAMQRRVENLDICIAPLCHAIDLNIFSCTTLVVLKLRGLPLRVCVSSPIDLPSLKSLHLVDVCLQNDQSFLDLICGCPLLEDLKLDSVLVRYIHPDKSFDQSFDQEFRGLPKLVSAAINDINFRFPLKIISNAEFLSIEEWVFDKVVPEFPNLVHVVFTSVGSLTWHFVFEILRNCPKLQDFELVLSRHPDSITLLPYPQFIPECLTSHFRKCTLKNYKGTRCEWLFAQYIMQHSTFLRTMNICSKYSSSTEAKHKEELALCPRKSALCELSFK